MILMNRKKGIATIVWLALVLIMTIGTLSIPIIHKLSENKDVQDLASNKTEENYTTIDQFANETIDWGSRVPLAGVADMLWGGVKTVAKWFTEFVAILVTFLVHLVFPYVKVPFYVPVIITMMLLIFVLWRSLDNLYDLGSSFGRWALIIISIIFAVAIVLMITGVA